LQDAVAGHEHLPHAALAERPENLIRAEGERAALAAQELLGLEGGEQAGLDQLLREMPRAGGRGRGAADLFELGGGEQAALSQQGEEIANRVDSHDGRSGEG
jgi:hypothetical protein